MHRTRVAFGLDNRPAAAQELVGRLFESFEAAQIAEVVSCAAILVRARGVGGIDGHPADRVDALGDGRYVGVRHLSSASMIGHSRSPPS